MLGHLPLRVYQQEVRGGRGAVRSRSSGARHLRRFYCTGFSKITVTEIRSSSQGFKLEPFLCSCTLTLRIRKILSFHYFISIKEIRGKWVCTLSPNTSTNLSKEVGAVSRYEEVYIIINGLLFHFFFLFGYILFYYLFMLFCLSFFNSLFHKSLDPKYFPGLCLGLHQRVNISNAKDWSWEYGTCKACQVSWEVPSQLISARSVDKSQVNW